MEKFKKVGWFILGVFFCPCCALLMYLLINRLNFFMLPKEITTIFPILLFCIIIFSIILVTKIKRINKAFSNGVIVSLIILLVVPILVVIYPTYSALIQKTIRGEIPLF